MMRKGQRGSIMLMAIFAIGVALAGFTALGLGQMMWQKREIQKIADATARTAAAQVGDAPSFDQARQTALSNGLMQTDALQFECLFGQNNAVIPCTTTPEAVRVTVSRDIKPLFFTAGTTLRAVAAAEPSPVITAAIRTAVASVNLSQSDLLRQSEFLNSILSNVLGSNVQLSVADSNALLRTNVSVDLLQLSVGLGVTNLQELANLRVGLGTLLDTGNVQAGAPGLNLSVKQLLDQIRLPVGDLLNLDLTQADAARAVINLGDLAVAGILGSVQGRGVDLKLSNTPTGITLKTYVVEPPRILVARQKRGVRPVGLLRSGQIKIEVNFEKNASEVLNGITGLNVSNVSALKGGLYIQVGGAQVTVDNLICKIPRSASETRFTATNALFRLCLSNRPANFADTSTEPIICGSAAEVLSFNTNLSITTSVPVLNNLLGIVTGVVNRVTGQLLSVSIPATLDLSGNTNSMQGVVYGKNPEPYRIPNSTSDTLVNLLKPPAFRLEVKTNVLGAVSLDPLLQPLLDQITQQLLVNLYNTFTPLLAFVGGAVDSILKIPGIAVNEAFFDVERLDCSASRLIQ